MRRFLDYFQTQTIEEALNPSQEHWVDRVLRNSYMSSAKAYDRDDSLSFSDHAFGGTQHRIDIPTEEVEDINESVPHQGVHEHLRKHGYVIENYKDGLAVAPDGRKMRIGRVLERTNAPQEIKNAFTNDTARKSAKVKRNLPNITITRHPYDVAGMSTNRGWRSCMTLPSDMNYVSSSPRDIEDMPDKEMDQLENAGSNFGKVAHDIEQGTHVAYLGGVDDPIARINLKPLHATDENGDRIHTILRPESKDYGNGPEAFPMTVRKWTETHFPTRPGLAYRMPKELYNDGMDDLVYENSKETRKALLDSTMSPTIRDRGGRHIFQSVLSDDNIEPENVKHVWDTYHGATKYLANHKDRSVNLDDYTRMSKEAIDAKHVVSLVRMYGANSLRTHLSTGKLGKSAHDDAVDFIKTVPENISNLPTTTGWHNSIHEYASFLANSPHTTPTEIEDMYSAVDSVSKSENTPKNVKENLVSTKRVLLDGQKNTPHSVLSKAATDESESVVESAVGHDNASPDIIEIGLQHRNLDVKNAAAKSKNITDEQTDKILNNHYLAFHGAIGTRVSGKYGGTTNAYQDMIRYRLDNDTPINESHARKIAENARYAPHAFQDMIYSHKHYSTGVRVPEDVVQKAIEGGVPNIDPIEVIHDSPHIQKSHLDFAVNHPIAAMRHAVALSPKATKEHLKTLINDPRNQTEERISDSARGWWRFWNNTHSEIADRAKLRLESGEHE